MSKLFCLHSLTGNYHYRNYLREIACARLNGIAGQALSGKENNKPSLTKRHSPTIEIVD